MPIPTLAYGDSITADTTEGYAYDWCGARTSPELDCIPRGVNGERTAPGVARYLADLEADLVDAEYVVFAWGANDIRSPSAWDPAGAMLDPLESAVVATLDAGMTPVLWVPTPQYLTIGAPEDPYELANDRIEFELRPALEEMSNDYGIPIADQFGAIEAFGAEADMLYRDHVHFNGAGSEVLAATVLPESSLALGIAIGFTLLAYVFNAIARGTRKGAAYSRGPERTLATWELEQFAERLGAERSP